MKTIVVIFAFCICVNAMTIEELKIQLRDVQEICKAESGIDQQTVDDINEVNFDVEDEKPQRYNECILKQFNIVDESGNFKENIVQELTSIYLDENVIKKLVAECSVISDANIYIRFNKLVKCFGKYKTMKEVLNL
ncbi:odorant binding protein 19 isoform X1 [Apis mellifera]|uniref:OBP19 n=1 Tax=Apis mellifera TaxID=7460 RepID=Q1W635_APIME|nr:odorant binding protein 19 precursor [Apis mellifera]XP_016772293.1 odorant binding protein 19 isoform X1 [Apis mellifera]ABD92651.1 OBP19 [Apis mellifera]|eukprot:NP_001035299.1 odorant binding protein 19 precursor [Apis mellifera]